MKITDLALKGLKFDGTQRRIFDDALPNFGVRTYKSGIRFIVLVGTKRKSVTLGRYPEMTLKEARTEALRILNDKSPTKAQRTPECAISRFLEHCERKNKPRTVKDYTRLLKRFPSGWDKQTIITTLQAFRNTPGELSHLTTAFQVFLNWCVHNGYIEQNPIAGLRNQGRIRKRDRILTDDELKKIWEALGNDRFHKIVRILILTGLRRGEVRYITVQNSTVTIPPDHTKNGQEHTFPLGPLSQQYIEPVTFNGWSKSKAQLDKLTGVTDYTLHDIRRTYASNHARLGTPIHVVEKLLNHVSGSLAGVAGIYNRYSYMDEMQEAVQRYEDWLSSKALGHVKP